MKKLYGIILLLAVLMLAGCTDVKSGTITEGHRYWHHRECMIGKLMEPCADGSGWYVCNFTIRGVDTNDKHHAIKTQTKDVSCDNWDEFNVGDEITIEDD